MIVDPHSAAEAIGAGTPLVVDVTDRGSGWWIIAVVPGMYTIYRDTVTDTVPWAWVR